MNQLSGSFDPESDAAYVHFTRIGPGVASQQVNIFTMPGRYELVLDLDSEGRLLGLEIIGALDAFPPGVAESLGEEVPD